MNEFYKPIFQHPLYWLFLLLGLVALLIWYCWSKRANISRPFHCCNDTTSDQDTSFFQSQTIMLPSSPKQKKRHRQGLKGPSDPIRAAEEGLNTPDIDE